MQIWPNMKVVYGIIFSRLVLFTLIWPQNTSFGPYLSLFTYIHPYLSYTDLNLTLFKYGSSFPV